MRIIKENILRFLDFGEISNAVPNESDVDLYDIFI